MKRIVAILLPLMVGGGLFYYVFFTTPLMRDQANIRPFQAVMPPKIDSHARSPCSRQRRLLGNKPQRVSQLSRRGAERENDVIEETIVCQPVTSRPATSAARSSSSRLRAPLPKLHAAHAVTRLERSSLPPSDTGVT